MSNFVPGMKVSYQPDGPLGSVYAGDGIVSSVSEKIVWVRFNRQLREFGWHGTTAQACSPRDLVIYDQDRAADAG